ncbi:ribonuclease H-like domain-containing protein, partial [Tanacetum coccineum]
VNMADGKIIDFGANQHMTHIDKNLNNVYDISHFRIKVGHPNETKAFISKIGNLRVDPGLNGDQSSHSDTSNSFVPGEDVNTIDFLSGNIRNDAQSSDDIHAAQNEQVTILEENIFSEGNLDENPNSSSHGTQTLRRSSRKTVFPRNYNDFVVDSKVNKLDALLRNDTWEITKVPKDRKDVGVFVALLVYVNDIIITSNSMLEIEKFKTFLKSIFMIKDLEKLKYFIGIEVIDTD